jgi:8-oxo-dGTP diphosphatase
VKTIEVAIALVWREGLLLVTRRPTEVHLGGLWEFPGGKLRTEETPEACAEREVLEEVGLVVSARARRASIEHTYPERRVLLYPVDCDYHSGDIELREVTDARWVAPKELATLEFPEANRGLIAELSR